MIIAIERRIYAPDIILDKLVEMVTAAVKHPKKIPQKLVWDEEVGACDIDGTAGSKRQRTAELIVDTNSVHAGALHPPVKNTRQIGKATGDFSWKLANVPLS